MAFSVISHVSAGSVGGAAVTTGNIDTSGANDIFLAVADYLVNAQAAITDSKSNTWTLINTIGISTTRVRLYYSKAPTVGTGHNFTGTGTASYPGIAVVAVSGSDTVSPLDQQTGISTGGNTVLAPGSITPGVDGEFVLTALGGSAAQASLAVSLTTILETVAYSAGNNFGVSIAYVVQGAAAAINPAWSWTTSCEAAAAIASFKEAPTLAKQFRLRQAVMRAANW